MMRRSAWRKRSCTSALPTYLPDQAVVPMMRQTKLSAIAGARTACYMALENFKHLVNYGVGASLPNTH